MKVASLGSDEFVDAIIHRIGETKEVSRPPDPRSAIKEFNFDALLQAVETVCELPREEFCRAGKNGSAIAAKELFILAGCDQGATLKLLSEIAGVSRSAVSRRKDAARLKVRQSEETSNLLQRIEACYRRSCLRIAKSQA